ncbi:hypothetical protein CYMTET_54597 [Cymbomonas tetramitiformis]|uniref:Uncharacterized protein n=1 Tax=Cymbomonas tetramitiformis TaxID=36881 RepID=A0AAE0BEK7_9CHLO|nr:hypothetical protein CYMTET_54597 [Cymbomonas tetramitiformis]
MREGAEGERWWRRVAKEEVRWRRWWQERVERWWGREMEKAAEVMVRVEVGVEVVEGDGGESDGERGGVTVRVGMAAEVAEGVMEWG